MSRNFETVVSGTSVTVRNHAIGASLTFRDGVRVGSEGNYRDLTKNNIANMQAEAARALAAARDNRNAA